MPPPVRRYRALSAYLRERFGARVRSVTIDAGFTCPNVDGTVTTGGCVYCDNRSFSPNRRLPRSTVRAQVERGIEILSRRYKAERFIAYFQAGTNTHGAVEKLNRAYREGGVALPPTAYAGAAIKGKSWAGSMILAPPSAQGTPWARKFGPVSYALASGWMTIRGTRRRKSVDRGFILSDHVDWPGLMGAIEATGAGRVLVTHGYTSVVVKYLREQGIDADVVPTRYEGERDDKGIEELEADEETAADGSGGGESS